MNCKIKIQYEIQSENQTKPEQIKQVIQVLKNDAEYKILLNKNRFAVSKINKAQTKTSKKKIDENKTQATITVFAEVIKQSAMIEKDLINHLLRYNNKKDEIKSNPISVEVIEIE